ncbi:MAG: DNA polymerase III subunit beta [Rickettsiaceae bacterium]|nr:DNA polymerase III subunit beta [Rickettsiaceae bacterium]
MTEDISTIEKPVTDKKVKLSSTPSSMFKIKVNSKDLINALTNMRSVTDKSGVIEGLSDVKITAQDNFITIEATDIDVYLYQKIGATVISPGQGRLDSETFYTVINAIKDEFIEISQQNGGDKLEITGENCYFSLPALSATEFPHMEDVIGGTKLSLNCNDLDKIINYTKFAMSLDETRYNLNGLYFHIKDNKFYSAATDGHRLSVASASSGFTSNSDNNLENENFGVILPQKTIDKLTKIFKAGESGVDIILAVNKIKFSFNDGKIILISKIIDGKFPDYNAFIPQGNQNKLTVNKELFEPIIKRVSTVTVDKFKAIKINIGKDMLEITSVSSPKGAAREVLKFSSDNDKLCMLEKNIAGDEAVEDKNIKDCNNIVIGCNSKYLEDILSALKKEQVIEIYFNDDSRAPLLIKIANNPTDNFIIMPVKV